MRAEPRRSQAWGSTVHQIFTPRPGCWCSDWDQTPDKLTFQTMNDMAIVACEDGDTMALELAYQWARWVTCRELDSTVADWTRIQKAVEQATRALDVHKTFKGTQTAVKKSSSTTPPKWTDHLVTEIRAAIDVLGQAVDDAQEAQAA